MTAVLAPKSSDAVDSPALANPNRSSRRRTARLDLELEQQIRRVYNQARTYDESTLSPDRTKAIEYYKGDNYGDEIAGRAQVVTREVRDTVYAFLPAMLQIFCGARRWVEFIPQRTDQVRYAAQATDFINEVVLVQDNPGYRIMQDGFIDAMVKRTGIFKWWWDERREVTTTHFTGQTRGNLQILAADDDVTKVIATEQDGTNPHNPLYDVIVKRVKKSIGRARVAACPPEEVLWAPGTRDDISEALAVFHTRMITVSDGVSLGIAKDLLLEHAEAAGTMSMGASGGAEEIEKQARRPGHQPRTDVSDGMTDPLSRKVRYSEGYVRFDRDGDNYAELHKVQCIGRVPTLVDREDWDEIPFAVITPFPEPHEIIGQSITDITMDIQRINSAALRLGLDAFSESVLPGWEAVEGQVNLEDLQNNDIGRTVRVLAPNMVRQLTTPVTGDQMFSVLGYMKSVMTDRTKQSDESQGVNADKLQSTSEAAVAAITTAAAAQQGLMARNFAETGLKRMIKGLLKLTIKHQQEARMVKLRGEFVQVDPREWDAEMDVSINLGLGGGGTDEVALLAQIQRTQEGILTTQGLQNPLVGPNEYRATLAEVVRASGRKNPDTYYKQVPEDWQPPAASPDAASQLAQVQTSELQLKSEIERGKLTLAREKMLLDDQRERLKIAYTLQAQIAIANGRAGQASDIARIQIEADRDAAQLEQQGSLLEAKISAATEMHGNTMGAMAQMHGNTTQADAQVQAAQQTGGGPSGA